MSVVLRELTLLDTLGVCLHLPQDERDQFAELSGAEFDPETATVFAWSQPGPKWCIATDDKPLVACGYTVQRPGVYESWYLATAEAWRPHGKEVTARTVEIIQGMLAGPAHRLETYCLASRKLARRWYSSIGLHHEATLKRYSVHGADVVIYAAVSDVP